jgi:hypothetical protein
LSLLLKPPFRSELLVIAELFGVVHCSKKIDVDIISLFYVEGADLDILLRYTNKEIGGWRVESQYLLDEGLHVL